MLYSWQLAVEGLCMLVALDSMSELADGGFTRVGTG